MIFNLIQLGFQSQHFINLGDTTVDSWFKNKASHVAILNQRNHLKFQFWKVFSAASWRLPITGHIDCRWQSPCLISLRNFCFEGFISQEKKKRKERHLVCIFIQFLICCCHTYVTWWLWNMTVQYPVSIFSSICSLFLEVWVSAGVISVKSKSWKKN